MGFSFAFVQTVRTGIENLRPAVVLLACCFGFSLAVADGYASPFVRTQDDSVLGEDTLVDDASVFMPAPRELLRPLIRARKAIDRGDTARAAELIGAVLSDPSPNDYLIKVPNQVGIVSSLRKTASDMLGSLPLKDRQSHRLRYSVQARQKLEAAVADSDFLKLAQVMQRFFYTESGSDAAMLLGYHHLEQGHPAAAAFCFQRVVDNDDARIRHEPSASVLLATCRMLVGNESEAQQALLSLKQQSRRTSIQFSGKDVELFVNDNDAIPWLKKLVGDSPLASSRAIRQWTMFRGNPQRNATNGSGVPLFDPSWSVPVHNNPDDEKMVLEHAEQLILDGATTIPSVQPIAVGNTVVMRTFDRLVGINFETGKREWMFPTWDQETFFQKDNKSERPTPVRLNKNPLAQRMWQDHLFGQSSSDGRNIFIVPEPGFAGSNRARMPLANGRSVEDPKSLRVYNELIAVDISRQGALKWEVGGKTGRDEPALAEAFFLGPPLPLDGLLMVVCEQGTDVNLVALDPETGKQQWSQHLASTEIGGKVAANQFRRLAGATPSYSDGLVICPTGVGAVVAVEVATRSLVWGFQYSAGKNHAVSSIMPQQNSTANNADGTWRDPTITISGGNVLMTPVDQQELICLDLLSGRSVWQSKGQPVLGVPRKDSLFIGCVVNEHILLIGRERCRVMNLRTGEEAWSLELNDYGRPSGRGYSNGKSYYCPMTSEQIVQFDISTGKIEQVIATQGVLGNLICYQNRVVSHSATTVATFPQDEANLDLLSIENSEATSEQLLVKAQLEVQRDEIESAARTISHAFDQSPEDRTRKLLVSIGLQLLHSGSEEAEEFSQRYSGILVEDAYLQMVVASVDGLILQKNHAAALQVLLQQIGPDSLVQNRDETIDAAPRVGINDQKINYSWEQWLRIRIGQVASEMPEAQDQIQTFLAEVTVDDPEMELLVAKTIGLNLISNEARLELIKRLLAKTESIKGASNFIAAQRVAMWQAELLDKATRAEYAGILDSSQVDAPGDIDGTAQISWNIGRVNTDRFPNYHDNSTPYFETFPRCKLQLIDCDDNPELQQYQFKFFGQTGEVEILDQYAKLITRFGVRESREFGHHNYNSNIQGKVQFSNGLALINIGTELVAVDWNLALKAKRSPVMWVIDIRDHALSSSSSVMRITNAWGHRSLVAREYYNVKPLSVAKPSFSGVWYINQTKLICVDPLTGRQLWERPNIHAGSTVLSDGKIVATWNARRREVRLFVADTGQQLESYNLPADMGSPWISRGASMLFSKTMFEDVDTTEKPDESRYYSEKELDKKPQDHLIRRTMIMYNFVKKEPDWERTFPKGTTASVLRNDRIIVVDPVAGQALTLSAKTGQNEFTTPLDLPKFELERIETIEVKDLVHGYYLYIHTSDRSTRYTSPSLFYVSSLTYYKTSWDGFIFAINKNDGTHLWKSPARIHLFQSLTSQPYNAPALFFLRRLDYTISGRTRKYWIQLVGIDVRNGRWAAHETTKYHSSTDYRINSDSSDQSMTFKTRYETLKFQWTDEALPPSPVARIDKRTAFYFGDRFKKSDQIEFVDRKQERSELIKRLLQFQEKELEKKRAEMKKQFEKQAEDPAPPTGRKP